MSTTELDKLLMQRFGPKVRRGGALHLQSKQPEPNTVSQTRGG